MSLTHISHNFYALHASLNSGTQVLVSRGDWLYTTESVSGKAYGWISSDESVSRAVQKTALLFKECLQTSILPLCDQFEKSLNALCFDQQIDEAALHRIRSTLQQAELGLRPFLARMQQPKGRAAVLITKYFESNPFAIDKWALLLRHCDIIHLECLSGGPLPWRDFIKLSDSVGEPSRSLNNWVIKLLQGNAPLDQGRVHRGLMACAAHIDTTFSAALSKRFSGLQLEYSLWRLGHRDLLTSNDPEQIQWRQTLKSGVDVGNYTLGRRLGAKLHVEDNRWVFEIVERTDRLIVVPQNRCLLALRNFAIEKVGRSEVLPYEWVAPDGSYALVENLKDPAVDIQWTEPPADHDKSLLNHRIQLIQHFLQQSHTPRIDLTSFRYDCRGAIKSIRSFTITDFDFNRIEEELIFNLAGNHDSLYAYLAIQSGIEGHPYAAFYSLVVEKAARHDSCDLSLLGGEKRIEDGTIIRRAEHLFREVAALREQAYSAAVAAGHGDASFVECLIIEQYRASHGVGRLLPGMRSAVMDAARQVSHGGLSSDLS